MNYQEFDEFRILGIFVCGSLALYSITHFNNYLGMAMFVAFLLLATFFYYIKKDLYETNQDRIKINKELDKLLVNEIEVIKEEEKNGRNRN